MPAVTRKQLLTWGLPVLILFFAWGISRFMASTPQNVAPAVAEGEVRVAGDTATVSVFTLQRATLSPELTLYGQVKAARSVQLTAPYSATLAELLVTEGERVSANQLLARLDTRDLERQRAQQETRLRDITARLSLQRTEHSANEEALAIEQELLVIAQRAAERTRNLQARNLAAESDVEAAERNLQQQRLSVSSRRLAVNRFADQQSQLQAQQREAELALQQLDDQLADAEIRAPFAGQVAELNIEAASRVTAQNPVMTVVSNGEARVEALLPTHQLASIEEGIRGQLAMGDRQYDVQLLGWEPITRGGSVRARFAFDASPERLVVNQFHRLALELAPQAEVFAVPAPYLYENRFVYRVVDERLERVTVDVVGYRQSLNGSGAPSDLTWTLIRSADLANGDTILASRLPDAAPGLAVIVRGEVF
ncbi:HlyD family efflux transporter periplasmic adaptor subunit [Salinispirillum sp. LH 10-3-1]|uniref:HlyD family efflux transporter periplasmic adaptor subunit n=1 Tax=Salinispirillum sp. LH 10-3-1 TaxID=2952525 RepID=A0AB38YJH4_9GAMM